MPKMFSHGEEVQNRQSAERVAHHDGFTAKQEASNGKLTTASWFRHNLFTVPTPIARHRESISLWLEPSPESSFTCTAFRRSGHGRQSCWSQRFESFFNIRFPLFFSTVWLYSCCFVSDKKQPTSSFFSPCGRPSGSLLAHHCHSFFFLTPQSVLIHLASADHSSLTDDLHHSEISICEMTKNRRPPPSRTTSSRQSKVWHMVPFHAWQESVREAHHCYCQIGPAVYSSITPSSLTVTGHHALYINSGCDIDLFPPCFDAEMRPVSTCFHKETPFSYFLHDFYSRPRKLLQPLYYLVFFFHPMERCCWPCSRAAQGP